MYEDVLCVGDGGDSLDSSLTPADNDLDLECDYVDLDDDNDGIPDSQDNWSLDPCAWQDTDSDGQPDNLNCPFGVISDLYEDDDDDGDGVSDEEDICPLELSSPDQVNSTGCIIPVIAKATFTEIVVDYTKLAIILFVICYIISLIAML